MRSSSDASFDWLGRRYGMLLALAIAVVTIPAWAFGLETHLEEIADTMRDFLQHMRSAKMISDTGIVHLNSAESVAAVLRRLLSMLQAKEVTVFAVIDHSGEAAKAGLTMPETKLVIFGKPEAGTPLMLAVPGSALDLPLKILIAEQPGGGTRVSYNSPAWLQSRYALDIDLLGNIAVIEQIAAAIVA